MSVPSQSLAAYSVEVGELHHLVIVKVTKLSGTVVARLNDLLTQLLLDIRVLTQQVEYPSERVGRRVHRR